MEKHLDDFNKSTARSKIKVIELTGMPPKPLKGSSIKAKPPTDP